MKKQPSRPNHVPPGRSISDFAYENVMSKDGTDEFLADYFERHLKNIDGQTGERLSADKYGCESLFIEYFVNEQMEDDFPLIAHDFYLHEFSNLSEYENVEYLYTDRGIDEVGDVYIRFTLNMMMNAVNSGSEYAKSLFIYLYKTYYKKEYKILKKFSSICEDDVFSIVEDDYGKSVFLPALARVMTMSKIMGIELDQDLDDLYNRMNTNSEWGGKPGVDYSFDQATGDAYRSCYEEIKEKYDMETLYSLDAKVSEFLANSLMWAGFGPYLVDNADMNDTGLLERLGLALSIYKKTYPGREYTIEDIVVYATILHAASALACSTDMYSESLKTFAFGRDGTDFYDFNPELFIPEEVSTKGKSLNVAVQKKEEKAPIPVEMHKYDEGAMIAELDSVRLKVRKLEMDNQELRKSLDGKRQLEEDVKSVKEELEAANRELSALRNYVYNLTEKEEVEQSISVDEMKKVLSDRRIIIIGGHSNWVSKMRNEFPDWVFINPEASGSTDSSIVDKADRVYFFTDTISHSKYYQFMNTVRERKVSFGYIHGVNIEKNIRGIYEDFK